MAASGLSRRRALTGAAGVGLALPVLAACGDDGGSTASDPASSGGPTGSPSPSDGSPGGSPGATGAPAGGTPLASTADIPVGGGKVFPDEGVVVTQPTAGTFKGFGIQCTHAGCPVDKVTDTIVCPCHGSRFSLTDGSPEQGPATAPLSTVALSVQGDQISLS